MCFVSSTTTCVTAVCVWWCVPVVCVTFQVDEVHRGEDEEKTNQRPEPFIVPPFFMFLFGFVEDSQDYHDDFFQNNFVCVCFAVFSF